MNHKKCRYKTSKGICGKRADDSYLCKTHREVACGICSSPALRDCPWPQCKIALCSDSCLKERIHKRHKGEYPHSHHAGKERKGPRKESVVSTAAHHCPYCENENGVPHEVTISQEGNAGKSNYAYIECFGCFTRGPRQKSANLAIKAWNSIPRGRPKLYLSLRQKALKFLENQLTRYEKTYKNKKAPEEVVLAVARALEGATVAVDTWE